MSGLLLGQLTEEIRTNDVDITGQEAPLYTKHYPAGQMLIRNLIKLRQFKLPEYDHTDQAVISFHKLEWG